MSNEIVIPSYEQRIAALETRDAFLGHIDRLSLKKGELVVIRTHIQLDSAAVSTIISRHVGFVVPVIILDPGDSVTVIEPAEKPNG